jgi:hypothetical protein
MTVNELRDTLLAWVGAAIVTIHTDTEPAMNKTGNPYYGARKRSAVNGIINWIYESAVNRQRVREGLQPDFKAYPRKWGQRIKGTPLVEHNGNFYLEMKVQQSNCTYYVGGTVIPSTEITPYLRPLSKSRQGVQKEIILRDYALDNIKGITYAGKLTEVGA